AAVAAERQVCGMGCQPMCRVRTTFGCTQSKKQSRKRKRFGECFPGAPGLLNRRSTARLSRRSPSIVAEYSNHGQAAHATFNSHPSAGTQGHREFPMTL